jgi:hypothetical protein
MEPNQLSNLPENQILDSQAQPSPTFSLLIQQAMGNPNAYKPTKEQVDKILALDEKTIDYVREDKKEAHSKYRLDSQKEIFYFITIIGILLIIIIFKSEYTSQALSVLLGGIGGYGFRGQKESSKE